MGWDIVAIGTNHTLPIDNPIETAKRLLPLCAGPVSIGYYSDWEYKFQENIIVSKFSGWKELSSLCNDKCGETVKFNIQGYCASNIYEEIGRNIKDVKFLDKDDKSIFISEIMDKYDIYELVNDLNWYPDNRIFFQIAEFSVDFPGRWFQFEYLFNKPYEGKAKEVLDKLRKDIYFQMKLCGCDKAYFFPDQSYGEFLYDKLNLPATEWLAYLMSGGHLVEVGDDDNLRLFYISDYISGNRILDEREYVHCFIDDFSDL